MAIDRNAVAAEIAEKISDYRTSQIEQLDTRHVLRWTDQFNKADRDAVLIETNHFLSRWYFSKPNIKAFARTVVTSEKLTGGDPKKFWSQIGFLRLQESSRSQTDLLKVFSKALQKETGLTADNETSATGVYVYLDDAIFTGRQIKGDIIRWIEEEDISKSEIYIIVIGLHSSGHWYANKELLKVATPRNIKIKWRFLKEIEDWKKPNNNSTVAVMWPNGIPNDQHVMQWLRVLPEDKKYFNPRPTLNGPANPNFSSEIGRLTLEKAFLEKGAYIRGICQNPSPNMHPLGYHNLRGPGFGTLFSTYRNCPNNAPLVLWWGDDDANYPLNQWHPLLPRRTRDKN